MVNLKEKKSTHFCYDHLFAEAEGDFFENFIWTWSGFRNRIHIMFTIFIRVDIYLIHETILIQVGNEPEQNIKEK